MLGKPPWPVTAIITNQVAGSEQAKFQRFRCFISVVEDKQAKALSFEEPMQVMLPIARFERSGILFVPSSTA